MKEFKYEPPKYRLHKIGSYSKVTKCEQCSNIGLREDCHPACCCKHCGGKVIEFGSAKWVKPVYKGFIFRNLIHKGLWDIV